MKLTQSGVIVYCYKTMKRSFLIFVLVCICLFTSHAQKKWTLEECIDYAISQNILVKQIELQKQNAEVTLSNSQMSRLPNLNASAGQNWNFGRTQIVSGLYENHSQSTNNLSVSSSVLLFTGFQTANQIRKSKLDLNVTIFNLERAKEDLSLNIMSLFLQILFNKEILKIREKQIHFIEMQLEQTRNLVNAGKVPHSQILDIEAQISDDNVSLLEAKNSLALALLDLAQTMELENPMDFEIYMPELPDIENEFIESPITVFNYAVNTKPSVKSNEFRVMSAGKSIKIAKANYSPSLALNLSYSNNYFYSYNSENNISFKDQIKNNAGKYIGLVLNIPLFNRFSVRNQVKNAKINFNNEQLILEDTKKQLYKEIQTAYVNATYAKEKYLASDKAISAVSESFEHAQKRYEVGKSTVLEFNEARNKLITSQSEKIRAKYDYIFRKKILDFYHGIPIILSK